MELIDLEQREGEMSFALEAPVGRSRVRFWGDVPAAAEPPVEAALAASILVAMERGEDISLPHPVSPRLRRALPDVQAVLATLADACYSVDRPLSRIEVSAPDAEPGSDPAVPAPGRGVAAFFSGGVDSWATLLREPAVTDLVYVHGFDIPLDQEEVSGRVEERLAAIAASRGLTLRVIRTDLRAVLDPSASWDMAHGPALVAVALLLAPACERVVIGAGMSYEALFNRGSHPLHDHLWSTEACRIEHHGAHLSRTAKTRLVADCQQALDVLRVCWRQVDRYNCGRCEKCLRTMVALEALGALDRCPTFEADLDLDAVAAVPISDPEIGVLWRENLELAREENAAAPLVEAVERCIEANEAESREEALEAELRALRDSRSWRLTEPLRRAGTAVRRGPRPGA